MEGVLSTSPVGVLGLGLRETLKEMPSSPALTGSCPPTKPPTPGHVFVLHGDLSKLACDAWMLPTDDKLSLEPNWNVSSVLKLPPMPPTWSNYGLRVLRIEDWPEKLSPPWLVNVGGIKLPMCDLCHKKGAILWCESDEANFCASCDEKHHSVNAIVQKHRKKFCTDIQWYIEGGRLFFEAACTFLRQTPPRNGRSRHLVALPLVGTGKGGASESIGGIVVELLPELYRAAERYGMDVALVTIRRPTFAAIELTRRTRFPASWDTLEAPLKAQAQRLAELAKRGLLVLFLGSGISAGAGLPVWTSLLTRLAKKSGMEAADLEALRKMDVLDQARVVEIRLGGSEKLGQEIAAQLVIDNYSLSCCLLAGLPVHEVVTTNFNQMFEMASRSIGLDCAILPYAPASNCDRWILKMHGSTDHPEDIVLTREDYMRYASRRSALRGIVQSLLITRHMLFAGFSLNDDNFHRIADEVRQALGSQRTAHETAATAAAAGGGKTPEGHGKFGSALNLIHNPLLELLWSKDLSLISMYDSSDLKHAEAARKLEIFLDYLLSEATTTTAFLLRPQYEALLSDPQKQLRDALLEFARSVPAAARQAPEWSRVQQMMKELGDYEENNYNFVETPKM